MSYLSLALGLIRIVQWAMGKLDENERKAAVKATLDALRIKLEDEVIRNGAKAYDDAVRRAADDPGSLRGPDKYSRT